jgi:hypothetical protein
MELVLLRQDDGRDHGDGGGGDAGAGAGGGAAVHGRPDAARDPQFEQLPRRVLPHS